MKSKYIIPFLLLLTYVLSYAQPVCNLKLYNTSDGYVNGSINQMRQDKFGLIWIASEDGLTKFDGYTFTTIKSYPGKGAYMGSSNITSIYENVFGDIWCKNEDGKAYLFDTNSQIFYDVLQNLPPGEEQNESVEKIIPVKNGVTWILCKDGAVYRILDDECKNRKGVSHIEVPGKTIYRIFLDGDGDEWVLTNKGVYIFGGKKINSTLPFSYIVKINRKIYLCDTENNFATYNAETGEIQKIQLPESVKNVTSLKVLKDKTLAMATANSGLLLLDVKTGIFNQINVNISPDAPNQVFRLYEDLAGDLWMWNAQPGIIHYNISNEKISILQSAHNPNLIHEKSNKILVKEDKQGNLWIVPKGGNLCYFDRESQSLQYAFQNNGNASSIVSPAIREYYWDKQGNLWFNNRTSLGKISFFPSNFSLIPKEIDEYEVRSILVSKDKNIWVGAKNNKLKILDKNYKLLGYLSENGKFSKNPVPFIGNIYAMLLDSEGNTWVGTRTNGLYQFIPHKKHKYQFSVKHYSHNPNNKFSLSNNSIYSIFEDSQQRLWVGTYGGGINVIEKVAGDSLRFINSNNYFKNYPISFSNRVRFIAEVKPNEYFVGSKNGLVSFSYDPKKAKETRFHRNIRNAQNPHSLKNNDVFYIYSDQDNNIFVMVQNGGVNKVISKNILSNNIKFQSFTEQDGLLSDMGLSMIEDSNHKLWLISKQGLSQFDPQQKKFDHYNSYIYNQNIVFSEAAPVLSYDGKLLMGTDKGILEFDPFASTNNKIKPSIIFTRISLQGEKIERRVDNLDSLVMNPKQRNISLQFATLDYADSKNIKYAYKMGGIDGDWNYSGPERSASYINLSPGKYRFMVKSTNSNGIWEETIRTLNIKIQPRFVETVGAWILFIAGGLLLLGIIVYVLFSFYRLRYAVEMEKKLSGIKLRFFTDISHELRTPLTLITSPISDILERESLSVEGKEHLNLVKKNTDRMLRIVNQILDFRKIQANKMKLQVEKVELAPFISQVMDEFRGIAKEKNIQFQLNSSAHNLSLWVDKDKFEKILFNLLSNAFKYTLNEKSIAVNISYNKDRATIRITDQGIGIVAKKLEGLFQRFETLVQQNVYSASSGIGLSLVKELVELHHGTIDVSSQPGKGSSFSITFPVGKSHLEDDNNVEFVVEDMSVAADELEDPPKNGKISKNDEQVWNILIVEDNAELRRFLFNILKRDYGVWEAENGKDGIEKAKIYTPDLIVSDVMMPVMDGLEMVREIKENRELCHIPIILLSAKSAIEDRIKGLEHGIDDYITKPFGTQYFLTRVHNLIQQRQLLQQTYLSSVSKQKVGSNADKLSPSLPKITTQDEQFIQQLMSFMEQNMDNPNLSVDDFVTAFSMSRSVFFKKMKILLGVSPVNFIRDMRIQRAIQLLNSGINTVSEVAYRCGFSDPNYFTKTFKKIVGIVPSDYKNRKVETSD